VEEDSLAPETVLLRESKQAVEGFGRERAETGRPGQRLTVDHGGACYAEV